MTEFRRKALALGRGMPPPTYIAGKRRPRFIDCFVVVVCCRRRPPPAKVCRIVCLAARLDNSPRASFARLSGIRSFGASFVYAYSGPLSIKRSLRYPTVIRGGIPGSIFSRRSRSRARRLTLIMSPERPARLISFSRSSVCIVGRSPQRGSAREVHSPSRVSGDRRSPCSFPSDNHRLPGVCQLLTTPARRLLARA